VGDTYQGTVKSVTAFGAFIEIMPGTEALLHVSEMRHTRVEKPEDVVKKGETVTVKLIDRDERGRLRLSMKALLPKPEGGAAPAAGEPAMAGASSEGGEESSEGGERPRRERSPRGGRGGRGRE
jgi:polyribonucleotide nucleotidyltransferase